MLKELLEAWGEYQKYLAEEAKNVYSKRFEDLGIDGVYVDPKSFIETYVAGKSFFNPFMQWLTDRELNTQVGNTKEL